MSSAPLHLGPAPFSIFNSFEVTSLHKRSLAHTARTASECLLPVLVEDLLQGFQEGLQHSTSQDMPRLTRFLRILNDFECF